MRSRRKLRKRTWPNSNKQLTKPKSFRKSNKKLSWNLPSLSSNKPLKPKNLQRLKQERQKQMSLKMLPSRLSKRLFSRSPLPLQKASRKVRLPARNFTMMPKSNLKSKLLKPSKSSKTSLIQQNLRLLILSRTSVRSIQTFRSSNKNTSNNLRN